MNTYDQIVASAYYVFGNHLTTRIISVFLLLSKRNGNVFEEEELKLQSIKDKIIMENGIFKLKDCYSISDIADCINLDMVTFFQNLKCSRDRCCSMYKKKNEGYVKKRGI